jgi:scyllo-inositol 2-dehydrogenase (NADP+)
MADSLRNAALMIKAAHDTGKHLLVSHNFLYCRAMLKAKRLLPSLGELQYIQAIQFSSFKRRLPLWYPQLPGGLFWDETPHLLYMLRYFAGPMELVSADVHDTFVEAKLEGTCPAQLTIVQNTAVAEWHVLVVGERGMLDVDLFRDICVHLPAADKHASIDVLKTSWHGVSQHTAGFVQSGLRYISGLLYYGHDVMIRQVIAGLKGNTPQLERSLADLSPSRAYGGLELMSAILERGREVKTLV